VPTNRSARQRRLEHLARLGTTDREHHPLDDGPAGFKMPNNLINLNPCRLVQRKTPDAGPEGPPAREIAPA
jgi:hypothetical protein